MNKYTIATILIIAGMFGSMQYGKHTEVIKRVSRARAIANAQEVGYKREQMRLIKLSTTALVLNRAKNFINNF